MPLFGFVATGLPIWAPSKVATVLVVTTMTQTSSKNFAADQMDSLIKSGCCIQTFLSKGYKVLSKKLWCCIPIISITEQWFQLRIELHHLSIPIGNGMVTISISNELYRMIWIECIITSSGSSSSSDRL